jgi:hypothetical protein
MPVCVINQPGGLGDIIWIQPIVDHMIDRGYEVIYPVKDVYYEMISRSIRKDGLRWVPETGEYPMKECFSSINPIKSGEDLYLPIQYADRHLPPHCPVMISKYCWVGIPIKNWHNSFTIDRKKEKENRVFEIYNIDRSKPYSLVNMTFGTPPDLNFTREISVPVHTDQVLEMKIDKENDLCLFDWMAAIEEASEIHTVETAVCYLVDKYAKTENINMYEKRRKDEPSNYYNMISLVYRNPNWMYHYGSKVNEVTLSKLREEKILPTYQ